MPVPNATVNAVRSLEKRRPPVPLPPEGEYSVEGETAHPVMVVPGMADAPILILASSQHSAPPPSLRCPPEKRPHRVMFARLATKEEKKVWQEISGAPSPDGLMTIQTLAPAGQLGKFVLDTRTPPVSYLPTL